MLSPILVYHIIAPTTPFVVMVISILVRWHLFNEKGRCRLTLVSNVAIAMAIGPDNEILMIPKLSGMTLGWLFKKSIASCNKKGKGIKHVLHVIFRAMEASEPVVLPYVHYRQDLVLLNIDIKRWIFARNCKDSQYQDNDGETALSL